MITLGGFLAWVAILYLVTAVLWGIYATGQQRKFHPTTSLLKYFLVFIVNMIFMPICMLLAIVNSDK